MMQNKWRAIEETEENWGNSKDARKLWWNYGRLETQKKQQEGLLQYNVDSDREMSITEKRRAVRKPAWWLMDSQACLASWTHTLGPRRGLKVKQYLQLFPEYWRLGQKEGQWPPWL